LDDVDDSRGDEEGDDAVFGGMTVEVKAEDFLSTPGEEEVVEGALGMIS
jgi:hypothetical protein